MGENSQLMRKGCAIARRFIPQPSPRIVTRFMEIAMGIPMPLAIKTTPLGARLLWLPFGPEGKRPDSTEFAPTESLRIAQKIHH
jgi:hypothetical protein